MQYCITAAATAALILSSATLAATAGIPDELVLAGDNSINVIINGLPFKMEIDPDIGYGRVLNADSASKLGLKGSMIGGLHLVGPIRIMAQSNILKYEFGTFREKNRTFWLRNGKATAFADGTISASALPNKIVKFTLKTPSANETIFTLPISKDSRNAVLSVNGQAISVGFNLRRDETLATASTGILLSQSYDGGFSGETMPRVIRFGIERPTKPLTLAKPMDIGGLPLTTLLVRVSDFGDATTIKNIEDADNEEIVVTATSKKKPRHTLSLGRDFLSRCSSLTFDYTVNQVKMSCAL